MCAICRRENMVCACARGDRWEKWDMPMPAHANTLHTSIQHAYHMEYVLEWAVGPSQTVASRLVHPGMSKSDFGKTATQFPAKAAYWMTNTHCMYVESFNL